MAEYLTQFLEWESKFNVDSILEFHNAQYDTAHPTPTTLVALVYTRLRRRGARNLAMLSYRTRAL